MISIGARRKSYANPIKGSNGHGNKAQQNQEESNHAKLKQWRKPILERNH